MAKKLNSRPLKKRVHRRRTISNITAGKPKPAVKLTESQILARDWMHASTDAINREIASRWLVRKGAQDDIARLSFELSAARKTLGAQVRAIEALENVIESRSTR